MVSVKGYWKVQLVCLIILVVMVTAVWRSVGNQESDLISGSNYYLGEYARHTSTGTLHSELTRFEFSMFEPAVFLVDGEHMPVDGVLVALNDSDIPDSITGSCNKPNCNGAFEWVVAWISWFPSTQQEYILSPLDIDELFYWAGTGSLVCVSCSAFHGSGNFSVQEWIRAASYK